VIARRPLAFKTDQYFLLLDALDFDHHFDNFGNPSDDTAGNAAIKRKPIKMPGRHQWRPGK